MARQGRLVRYLPPLAWGRAYDRVTLRHDVVSGLTVGVMIVPQSMAYAALAGLPPVVGLYAATVPLLVYALLGTSGQLAVGPVAISALLTASTVAPLADGDAARYITLAAVLALLVGGIQVALGLVRGGVLVNFLSHAVIVGFTSGAALLIGASQLDTALGVDVEGGQALPGTLAALAGALAGVNWPTFAVTAAGVAILVGVRRVARWVPSALVLVVVATAVSGVFGLDQLGVDTVGDVPAGLPSPSLPVVSGADLLGLLPGAVAIAIISYAEGISVAKALAARSRQRLDPDQELRAIGAANVSAGVFGGFPVAGGFSRSAVAAEAGARTPLSGAVAAGVVVLAVTALTPLLVDLPSAALAAIVLVAVVGLVDAKGARGIARTSPPEGVVLAITFAGTLLLGVELGLAGGVGASIVAFLWRSADPHIAELGRVEGATVLRNVRRWPVRLDPRVALLRVDGALYFASAMRIADAIRGLVADRPALEAVVLDASAISQLDASGAQELEHVAGELAEAGVALHLATVRGPVRDVLARIGPSGHLPEERRHATSEDAIAAVAGPDSPLLRPHPDEPAPEHIQ